MAATYRLFLKAALGAVLLLAGCAGAPPPPRPEPVAALPPVAARSPRELALERGPRRAASGRPLPLRGHHPRRGGLLRARPGALSAGRS